MATIDRINKKIRNRNRMLSGLMAGNCLFVFTGIDYTNPASLFQAVPYAGFAALSFGGLYWYAHKLKSNYLQNLPSYASAEQQTLKAIGKDHEAQKIARELALKGRYKLPAMAINEHSHSLVDIWGDQLMALNGKLADDKDREKLRFALASGLAAQKYEDHAAYGDYHNGVSLAFNLVSRWFLIPLSVYVVSPISDYLQKLVLDIADPHTEQFINDAVAVDSKFNWWVLSFLATASFLTRGSLQRNITLASDVEALKLTRSLPAARSYLEMATLKENVLETDYLADDFRWVAKNVRPLAPIFNMLARQYERIPELPVPRILNPLNYIRMATNAFMAIGQNRYPSHSRRMRYLEEAAKEMGLPNADAAPPETPATPKAPPPAPAA